MTQAQDEWRAAQRRLREVSARRDRRFHILMASAFISFFILVAVAVWYSVAVSWAQHDRFMAGCLEDHKEYECMAMWRAGDRASDVVVVPMPTSR